MFIPDIRHTFTFFLVYFHGCDSCMNYVKVDDTTAPDGTIYLHEGYYTKSTVLCNNRPTWRKNNFYIYYHTINNYNYWVLSTELCTTKAFSRLETTNTSPAGNYQKVTNNEWGDEAIVLRCIDRIVTPSSVGSNIVAVADIGLTIIEIVENVEKVKEALCDELEVKAGNAVYSGTYESLDMCSCCGDGRAYYHSAGYYIFYSENTGIWYLTEKLCHYDSAIKFLKGTTPEGAWDSNFDVECKVNIWKTTEGILGVVIGVTNIFSFLFGCCCGCCCKKKS